jgi:sugar-phosphatase
MTTGTPARTALRVDALLIDALLIDLDGTLADSHASIVRTWDGWAARYGVDPARIHAIMPGRTAVSVMREVRPDLPAAVMAADGAELLDQQVTDTADVRALPGARELLAAVPAGRWALVTAGDDRLARARLRAAGLPEPTVLVGCDSVARSKPDPEGYLLAAARLAADPARCLVIEDAPAGVTAGLAAGATVLALPPAAEAPAGAPTWPDGRVLTAPGLAGVRVTVVRGVPAAGGGGVLEVGVGDGG